MLELILSNLVETTQDNLWSMTNEFLFLAIPFKYHKKAYHHNHHQTGQQSFKNNTFPANDIHIVTQMNKTTTKLFARTYMIIHCISHMHPPT